MTSRQVHPNERTRNTGLALDLVLFINGLPVLTFELKNNLTKQTVEDAVEQYKQDRDPKEDLFRPGALRRPHGRRREPRPVLRRAGRERLGLPAL